jgi:D-arginine dehydrogenase
MRFDIAIVGAGIAGASLAAELAPYASVLLLEAEDQPGYHATGRSAAFWTESYGGPGVQPLTSASGAWLETPARDFSSGGFLRPRGALYLARAQDAALIEAFQNDFDGSGISLQTLTGDDLEARLPDRLPVWDTGLWERSCADIEVAALHACYLSAARRHGALIATACPLREAARENGIWSLRAGTRQDSATILVNAAGAWADPVAAVAGVRAIGIQAYRRTIARVRTSASVPVDLPLVIDINGKFYFKPDGGGHLWLSPHDETPSPPCDAAPEELDIAVAIDQLERVMSWRVEAVDHAWAGLRSFAPDRLPVYGFDADVAGFFWFAGQGGFGIQTAPAAAKLATALLLERAPDAMVAKIDPALYAPGRFFNTECR